VGVRHLRWKGPAIKEEQERGRSTAERFVWVAVLLVCIVAAFIFALRGEVENQVALWIIRAVEGLIFMSALIRLGYDYPGTEFSSRTLWDWLQLLSVLAIPVVLALATLWFTARQNDQLRAAEYERAQAEALQAYLDQMSQLMLDKNLLNAEEDSAVRTLARARTIAVLDRLDPERKITVLRFLDESHLIDKEHPVVALADADFTDVHIDFHDLFLHDANLDGANFAGSVLKDVEFDGADMIRANLQSAQLQNAFLIGVDLRYAWLGTNQGVITLTGPVKGGAEAADLSGADLSDADLRRAYLGGLT